MNTNECETGEKKEKKNNRKRRINKVILRETPLVNKLSLSLVVAKKKLR